MEEVMKMKTIVTLVSLVLVVLVSGVAFGQEAASASAGASASRAAPAMCGLLEVPAGCTCKDAAKNELDCVAGAVQVVAPAGAGKMVVEDGGKTTVYVPAQPIAPPPIVQPEKKDTGWGFWDYALFIGGAAALGTATYYVVDGCTTTEVHIRDK
ncbi:hypothetical protein HY932_03265 [Candidatus Falkowbacteria bacterium]|nr:hypothetical protein [Candidatus Falkowbacteria bacterium]